MNDDRAKIDRRDDVRRDYKEAARQFLKIVDERCVELFPRDKTLSEKIRKTTLTAVKQFISAVDRVDDLDDQIILFNDSLALIVPAIMLGLGAKSDQAIKLITEYNKKNSEAARITARQKKLDDMKQIKEFVISKAENYLSENPNFEGTRNGLMIQIRPEIDAFSKKTRAKTISESTIRNYLTEYNLP
jgi:hypothetical protein